MCGIVGAVSERPVQSILIEGLKRLEYRGYDSAGIALLAQDGLLRTRAKGKVSELEQKLVESRALVGIAHTRWATHGVPNELNAHPHQSGRFSVVHNGIIENHGSLRTQLKSAGFVFESQTDTETVAHLLAYEATKDKDLNRIISSVLTQLDGAYALAIIDVNSPDLLWVARKGSPLVIGVGHGEYFVGSDQLALLHVTNRFVFLEDGDSACLTTSGYQVYSSDGNSVERPVIRADVSGESVSKGEYRHFMEKEIHQQPAAIEATLAGRLGKTRLLSGILGPKGDDLLTNVEAVQIVACGTSYHGGLVARYWIESLVGIPCQVEIASEYRYRKVVTLPNTLWIAISQSGETADVLAALRHTDKTNIVATLAICNVPTSSLIRETDLAFLTEAGPEIGVASTKAFTTQLTVLLLLTGLMARQRQQESFDELKFVDVLKQLSKLVVKSLAIEGQIQQIAERFVGKQHALFLGRGTMNPIAMEGALKLKELSYIHAEAYPAGELKHGPLALVDENMPVIAVAPNDELVDKLKSNLSEVKARGGQLIVFTDVAVVDHSSEMTQCVMPKTPSLLAPIVFTIPLQLLSYHIAVLRGTDVDQPRNLAKSVTVE
ncbi:glutamine--fructose-6-phosphate transaminase (isomerizing) [Litorivicinus sp.]|nr:glutamine--fructose-6-phosphate transaminase (isomerizing) [Litorivicinus sp.]MDC1240755.1 glutamine--fructose-6-phosphate transaminase (isomerizing) [Litorivicinus sp.]